MAHLIQSGHHTITAPLIAWYPLALVALAVPNAWAGGKLYEKQMMRS
jgi:hypothetical protein